MTCEISYVFVLLNVKARRIVECWCICGDGMDCKQFIVSKQISEHCLLRAPLADYYQAPYLNTKQFDTWNTAVRQKIIKIDIRQKA